MNESAYKNFYDQVGKTNGWDFSKVKVVSEGVTWDFNEEIKKRTSSSGILLDIGTGGGENALRMAPFVSFLVGIDRSPEDLIFLLKHTPTIPNFGQEEKDFEILDDFIQNNLTKKGIRTNAKRFLISAKK